MVQKNIFLRSNSSSSSSHSASQSANVDEKKGKRYLEKPNYSKKVAQTLGLEAPLSPVRVSKQTPEKSQEKLP